MEEVAEHVAAIRDQLAGLLSQIDTASLPTPDRVHPNGSEMPGPEWTPAEGWTIRCDDDTAPPAAVFINMPGLFGTGDLIAEHTTDARRIATAILAACDWADGLAAGVTQLHGRRKGA